MAMEAGALALCGLLLLLLLLLGSRLGLGLEQQLIAKEEDASTLLAFKRQITHDPLWVLHSWDAGNTSGFCNWHGVVCSQQRRVTQLNLRGNLLQGSIAPELGLLAHLSSLTISENQLSGHIPSSLSNCSNLHSLSLANNSLIGSIPSELGFLHRLQVLFLYENNLTGPIPPSLGNCTALITLELDQNKLSGSIPAELGMLSHLQTLTLYQNNLSGPIPPHLGNCTALLVARLEMNQLGGFLPAQLWMLPHIGSFWAYGNKIGGVIPTNLGNCTSLTQLSLGSNELTGSLPAQLPPRLEILDLAVNKLSGFLPEKLGLLHELQTLRLGDNRLSGTIPSSLGNCSQLSDLELSPNRLTGAIPAELQKLRQLGSIKLRENNLTGHIPPELGNCTALGVIDLYDNKLEGSLPAELGALLHLQTLFAGENRLMARLPPFTNCTFLQALGLEANQLTGSISSWEFGALNKLHLLIISSNYLSGTIPTSLGNCTNLETVYLSHNGFTGHIPSTIGKLQNLQQLELGYNNFTGKIPREISNCVHLGVLVLSHNKLNGTLPQNLGLLQQLNILYLDNNFLTSVIPESLGGCSHLADLDLSCNNLNGKIPSSLSALRSLQYQFNLSHNMLSGPLPQWLEGAEMLESLDLSSNYLSGTIPESFGTDGMALSLLSLSDNNLGGDIPSSLGNLRGLARLILSKNMLVGTVPAEFARLDHLVQLDLAYNNLTGTLPSFLGNMSRMEMLNVSYNGFTGTIPDSGLFRRLNATSFLGNPGLCGPILGKICLPSAAGDHKHWLGIFTKHLTIIIPGLALLLFIGVLCHLQKFSRWQSYNLPSVGRQKRFTANELMSATEGFDEKNVIGVGSQSVVYKGVLAGGEVVAVKKLKDTGLQDLFFRELHILGRLRHRNIVRILGYVSNLDMKALVMEFMDNESLEWHLHAHEICQMDWEKRLRIAIAIANGLVYLHHDYGLAIIHGDLKPSNILIDSEFEAHVGDFGIAKLVSNRGSNETVRSTNVKGSIGYMAPEYAYAAQISSKVDVYSYGIILLEMLTVKRPIDAAFGSEMSLSQWVQSCFPDRAIEVLDETLRRTIASNHDQILRLMGLALKCREENPKNRPTMKEVSAALSKIIDSSIHKYPTLEHLVGFASGGHNYQSRQAQSSSANSV